MIKIENVEVVGLNHAIRGMRNPMNSWSKSDSGICKGGDDGIGCENCADQNSCTHAYDHSFRLGKADHALMMLLEACGPVHAKYRRMIVVYLDITAPLYWWKEFDTYKVGIVTNSCSTMHKIHSKPFTLDDFSHEHILGEGCIPDHMEQNSYDVLSLTIDSLNFWRDIFIGKITGEMIGKGDKRAWWQMIQLLPSSYNQKRTIMLNYEVLAGIYPTRKNHKLNEWREFCKWIEQLPYSEVITNTQNSVIYTRNEAAQIVELFEDVLDKYGIQVPSQDDDQRELNNEANLYGTTYWNLVDDVESRIVDLLHTHKTGTKVIEYELSSE